MNYLGYFPSNLNALVLLEDPKTGINRKKVVYLDKICDCDILENLQVKTVLSTYFQYSIYQNYTI